MKFGGTLPKHGVFTTLLHYRAKSVLLKNLLRWRADTIRPYRAYGIGRSAHFGKYQYF